MQAAYTAWDESIDTCADKCSRAQYVVWCRVTSNPSIYVEVEPSRLPVHASQSQRNIPVCLPSPEGPA